MTIFVWILLCIIWGTTWIFIKLGLQDLPPISFAAFRFSAAILILAPIIKFQQLKFPQTKKEWKFIALTGILQFALNYSAVFWSEQYITSGLAAVLQAMITVFGLVLAWIFLPAEKITGLKIAAVLLGIVGVAVIFFDQLHVNNWLGFIACAAIVGGSYAAAQASILIKARDMNLHPASLVFGQMLCASPFLIGYALIKEGNPLSFHWTRQSVICLIYLTIFGTIIAFWLYYWLLSRVESTKAMMISLVTPLIAVIVDWYYLGETLPPQTLFGGVLIILSIGLIVFRGKKIEAAGLK